MRPPPRCYKGTVKCVFCGASVGVSKTTNIPGGVQRERTCKRERDPHSFTTIERVPATIDMIGLRRSPTSPLAGAFDARKLHDDLRAALMLKVPEVLGPTTITSIVQNVASTVELTRRWHAPLAESELAVLEPQEERLRYSVLHRQVVHAVHEQLEAHGFEVQRILYELAVRRPANSHQSKSSARDVLSWLSQTFPSARRTLPPTATARREYSWVVQNEFSVPRTVLKRNGRGTQDFNLGKLSASISLSFAGRTVRQDHIDRIARWVGVSLEGQRRVHSAQLSAAVLDCLRRVDDTAYLRYAIAVKGLSSAEMIADEAEDLLTQPSARLRFQEHYDLEIEAGEPLLNGRVTQHPKAGTH